VTRALARWFRNRVARALTIGVCLSMATLIWFGYRAVREWQRSATLLAERQAGESVDMLVKALTRDMQGAQATVLSSPKWDEFLLDPPYDVRNMAEIAFRRYPYPESFFAWRSTLVPSTFVFLNRSDRLPPWLTGRPATDWFPVMVGTSPTVGQALLDRIRQDAHYGRRFSIFELTLDGVTYQVVARLLYHDAFREQLEGVFGFTVNLPWVREHYFPEVTQQVIRIRQAESVPSLSVVDDRGSHVAGAMPRASNARVIRGWFPLMFFDPLLVAPDPPADLSRHSWGVQVELESDPTLSAAIAGANRTIVITALAAATLVVGLLLTMRAVQARTRLTEMRSEFVSTVTHELKTPIATIRAIGDTLVAGRVSGPGAQHEYAQMVVQEAKRLTRLVDNLLAYARITDVTEVYVFAPLELGPLVEEVVGAFGFQIEHKGFTVELDIPAGLPRIRGDRGALTLMLDNLVDNALRYSADARWLGVRALQDGRTVIVEVSDRGVGIPTNELGKVTRKFFRGRRAGSGGSGLGLAIASRIAGDHEGSLTIRSIVDTGTTVRVALPIAEAGNEETHSRH
jgi:signal transduction histidine kinase